LAYKSWMNGIILPGQRKKRLYLQRGVCYTFLKRIRGNGDHDLFG
jgi:hypothetical protein